MNPLQKMRINAFDVLRGWCLIVISSDHLMLFPSLLDPLTGRGLLWVTAAEGFFFISGALVGIVRGRKMHSDGLKHATRQLWSRAGKLYVASVILTLLSSGLAYYLEAKGVHGIKGGLEHFGSVWELLGHTLTLQFSYGWTDFLNYYVVLLLLSPAALWLCRRGLWWVVMAAALAMWVGKTFVYDAVLTSYLTWQSYFFIGLIFGYKYQDIHGFYRSLSEPVRRRAHWLVYGLTAATIVASFIFTFGTEASSFIRHISDNPTFTFWLQNNRSGLGRLPMFLLWFGALFAVVRRYESWILKHLGGLLLPLGKNSLYVYIVSGVFVYAVTLLGLPHEFFLNSLVNVAAVALYWLAVRKRVLFSIIPR